MIAFRNQYWWGKLIRLGKVPTLLVLSVQSIRQGNQFIQMDFIQLSSLVGKYILVIVYMFSHWTEAFPL